MELQISIDDNRNIDTSFIVKVGSRNSEIRMNDFSYANNASSHQTTNKLTEFECMNFAVSFLLSSSRQIVKQFLFVIWTCCCTESDKYIVTLR